MGLYVVTDTVTYRTISHLGAIIAARYITTVGTLIRLGLETIGRLK